MSETACPTCGADGVKACVGLDGADHAGRPPYFDKATEAVLDSMARLNRAALTPAATPDDAGGKG